MKNKAAMDLPLLLSLHLLISPIFFFFLKYMQLSPAEISALFVLCGQLDAVQIEYSHKHTHLSTPEGLGWPCFLPPCGGLETLLVYNQIFSRH